MPYSPTTWVTGTTPLSAAIGNNFESQYTEATKSFNPDLLAPCVVSGGVGSIHGGNPKQLDVTTCTYYALQTDGTTRQRIVTATNFATVTPSTTYFLDYNADGSTSWATSHSGAANYVPIASVTTDGSGNISVITDARPINVNFFPNAVGAMKFAGLLVAVVGSHSLGQTIISYGNGAPGSLAANEIYVQLT